MNYYKNLSAPHPAPSTMVTNSTIHSLWQPELFFSAASAPAWLTAAPILLATLYFWYSRSKVAKVTPVQQPYGKRHPIGKIEQLRIHPIKVHFIPLSAILQTILQENL
jgi:hypothetical protein